MPRRVTERPENSDSTAPFPRRKTVCCGIRQNRPFSGLHRVWSRIREQSGLEDVRIHDLRHSFASVGAGASLGLPVIGALLGHTQATTTQRYAHLQTDPLKAAAERIAGEIDGHLQGQEAAQVVQIEGR